MQKLGNGYWSLRFPFLGKFLLAELQYSVLCWLFPFHTGGHLVVRVWPTPEEDGKLSKPPMFYMGAALVTSHLYKHRLGSPFDLSYFKWQRDALSVFYPSPIGGSRDVYEW